MNKVLNSLRHLPEGYALCSLGPGRTAIRSQEPNRLPFRRSTRKFENIKEKRRNQLFDYAGASLARSTIVLKQEGERSVFRLPVVDLSARIPS